MGASSVSSSMGTAPSSPLSLFSQLGRPLASPSGFVTSAWALT